MIASPPATTALGPHLRRCLPIHARVFANSSGYDETGRGVHNGQCGTEYPDENGDSNSMTDLHDVPRHLRRDTHFSFIPNSSQFLTFSSQFVAAVSAISHHKATPHITPRASTSRGRGASFLHFHEFHSSTHFPSR